LKDKNIKFEPNSIVSEVTPESVILQNGKVIPCNVAIWATGAEPQQVTADGDLEILKGFFRVNNFLQSTSHPNVFGGGDCITM
jgi:NADH:ubiquinone reductase (H+-translocating)